MLASQIPAKFPLPWAADAGPGFTHAIPVASQILITPGAASLTDGFPPLTFTDVTAGGIPPFGGDFNGILNQISAWSQWQNAGAAVAYDSAFSAAIGGYPSGALIMSAAGGAWWLSTTDNNVTDPDTGGSGWQAISYGNVYAGNPNGNVAGVAPVTTYLTQSLLWDTANKLLWLCTTTGNAASAVWTQLTGGGGGASWCGTSTGSPNAQILAAPTSLQSFVTGSAVSWTAGFTNSGAMTVTVGAFGTFPARINKISGLGALAGGEVVAGNVLSGRYNGTYIVISDPSRGTAAAANSSSNTGIVAAVSGSITAGHIALFTDPFGTVADGGPPGAAAAPTILTQAAYSGVMLGAGVYNADTTAASGGAFNVLLPASPVHGTCLIFKDVFLNWGKAYFTISRNGHTIDGSASDFICNQTGFEDVQLTYNSSLSDWRIA